jgi:phosphonate transport system permease protein
MVHGFPSGALHAGCSWLQIRVLEWQKVSFLILMILVAVAAIDWISGKLRFAIIGRRAVV